MSKETLVVTFDDRNLLQYLVGQNEKNIIKLETDLNVSVSIRGMNFYISGKKESVLLAKKILEKLYLELKQNMHINDNEVDTVIRKVLQSPEKEFDNNKNIILKTRKRNIVPFTSTQNKYIETLNSKEIVFATGPAGTGKTYLAVAFAVAMFLERKFDRIVLSRPAIEAGEKLGFLPGDLKEKIDPYLRPLYDALYDMIQPEIVNRLIENNEIEIAPLAYMRGRTLNNAIIILDEAQNTSMAQMKMFLTRMGNGSRIVVTGDPTQVDLPKDVISGLADAVKKLHDIKEIGFINFTESDIVRHPLTAKIIEAYEKKKVKKDDQVSSDNK